jgi:N-formylglutamate amidohydrolase
MIEVNRSLYMDEETGQKTAGFGGVRARIRRALGGIIHG